MSDNGTSKGYRPPTTDADVVDRAVKWLRRQQSTGENYFAWIHFMDAHTPYGRYEDHLRAIRGDSEVDHVVAPKEANAVVQGKEPEQRVIDTYDACIRRVDEQIGRILELVDDETIVAIVGDHGEEFGRYGEFHEALLYSSMTNGPIILRMPGLETGVVDEHFAQHVDLAPSLLHAADIPLSDQYVGEPLQEVDSERDLSAPTFYCLEEGHIGVQTDSWKVIQHDGGRKGYEMDRTETEVLEKSVAIPDELHGLLDKFEQQLTSKRIDGKTAELERDDELLNLSNRTLVILDTLNSTLWFIRGTKY